MVEELDRGAKLAMKSAIVGVVAGNGVRSMLVAKREKFCHMRLYKALVLGVNEASRSPAAVRTKAATWC